MTIKEKKAQTAVELAVFGSILIFVLGVIIRSAVNAGNQQHAMLKATRMAMTASHTSSETKNKAARNNASVLIVEDRLTSASAKYGAIDRSPQMISGSAVHSPNLFMPVDFGDAEDLPLFDLYVNGKHFAFSTAAFKTVQLARSCADVAPCPADCKGDCSAASPQYYRGADVTAGPEYWQDNCVEHTTTTWLPCADEDPCPVECTSGCASTVTQRYSIISTVDVGCAKLYTIVDNHPLIDEWCDDGGGALPSPCPADCSTTPVIGCNLPADERFDLDREDLDGLAGDVVVPAGQREGFAWQWYLVMGVEENWEDTSNVYSASSSIVSFVTAKLNVAEGIVLPGGETKAKNTMLDVDTDLKMESIEADASTVGSGGIIMDLGVRDPHEGDLDFSYNDSDEAKGILPFGFTRDVNLYTFVHGGGTGGGTYLQIDEGQLFLPAGDTKQYIRTASKKDQIDVIERLFRLSNNTGRYCGADGYAATVPTDWSVVNDFTRPNGTVDTDITAGERILGLTNPVEACGTVPGACFTSVNIERTCIDVDNRLILIRSRIQDFHGRKWVTEVSSDPYVDFTID